MEPIKRLRGLEGVLITIGVAQLLQGIAGGDLRPSLILALGVTYASARGGSAVAAIAVALSCGYYVLYEIGHQVDSHAVVQNTGTFLAVCAVIAALVTDLGRRVSRQLDAERRHAEQAEALETAKSAFLQLASHELRGPLGLISGYVSMLGDGSFGPHDAADIRIPIPILQAKVVEMQTLVDSLLQQARLEELGELLDRRRIDLRDVVQDAVNAIRPMAVPRHDLRWVMPRDAVTVDADPTRVHLIVGGILQNALKFSPGGGVVQIFLSATDHDAVISVWDHGLGIAPGDLPTLFHRFGRIVTPENAHIGGMGLGLYLAQTLARLHGGDIIVQSEEGHGSTFTVTLPLAAAAPPAPPSDRAGRPVRTVAGDRDLSGRLSRDAVRPRAG